MDASLFEFFSKPPYPIEAQRAIILASVDQPLEWFAQASYDDLKSIPGIGTVTIGQIRGKIARMGAARQRLSTTGDIVYMTTSATIQRLGG